MKADLLLIHPPAVKPAEPPLGTAVLLAHLRRKGIAAEAIDANIEAYLHLLAPERVRAAAGSTPSTAVRRAIGNLPRALALLRSPEGAASPARYGAAVAHLEAALSAWGEGGRLSLGDYVHPRLSEFAPADLERIASGEESTVFSSYYREILLPRAEALRPSVVALSVNYRHQVLPAFELAGLLRRRLPSATLVAGGGMLTSWGESLRRLALRFSCFDRIVLGPGEAPLSALALASADGYILEGEEASFHPDFGFAPRGDYLSPVPVLPVGTSRGCYWRRCLFCPEAAAPTHPYVALPPADVPPLLASLAREHGVKHFHLTDNAVPVPILRALAEQGSSEIGWHGFVRFEPLLSDADFVTSLARGGCRMLQLGLESGSPAVLERLGKGTDLETAARVLECLRRAGIAAYVYVLLGTPGETEGDAEATLAFLERYAGSISFLNLAIMNLPRDSAMLEDPGRFGIAEADRLPEGEPLGLYRAFTPAGGWGREEARRFLRRRLLGSPAIRDIVRRTPPAFTSNHAFLFTGRQ